MFKASWGRNSRNWYDSSETKRRLKSTSRMIFIVWYLQVLKCTNLMNHAPEAFKIFIVTVCRICTLKTYYLQLHSDNVLGNIACTVSFWNIFNRYHLFFFFFPHMNFWKFYFVMFSLTSLDLPFQKASSHESPEFSSASSFRIFSMMHECSPVKSFWDSDDKLLLSWKWKYFFLWYEFKLLYCWICLKYCRQANICTLKFWYLGLSATDLSNTYLSLSKVQWREATLLPES